MKIKTTDMHCCICNCVIGVGERRSVDYHYDKAPASYYCKEHMHLCKGRHELPDMDADMHNRPFYWTT
jgi:hypothetical protein